MWNTNCLFQLARPGDGSNNNNNNNIINNPQTIRDCQIWIRMDMAEEKLKFIHRPTTPSREPLEFGDGYGNDRNENIKISHEHQPMMVICIYLQIQRCSSSSSASIPMRSGFSSVVVVAWWFGIYRQPTPTQSSNFLGLILLLQLPPASASARLFLGICRCKGWANRGMILWRQSRTVLSAVSSSFHPHTNTRTHMTSWGGAPVTHEEEILHRWRFAL